MALPKNRIVKFVDEEFPGSRVVFDGNAGNRIHFTIEDSSGRTLTKGLPQYLPREIDDMDDEKLRAVIRALCGVSN